MAVLAGAQATGDAAAQLRPWLALLVLRRGRVHALSTADRRAAAPHARRTASHLPPTTENWAWAHAQLGRTVAGNRGGVGRHRRAPDQRAIAPGVARAACSPDSPTAASWCRAFEVGRLAGLGAPARGRGRRRSRRGAPATTRTDDCRSTSSARFTTATDGDFEALARQLVARPAGPHFGTRDMAAALPGFGLADAEPDADRPARGGPAAARLHAVGLPGSPGGRAEPLRGGG